MPTPTQIEIYNSLRDVRTEDILDYLHGRIEEVSNDGIPRENINEQVNI